MVRPLIQCIREENTREGCGKIEPVLETASGQFSKFQVLEIVRALHYFMREILADVQDFQNVTRYFEMDEELLMIEVGNQNSVSPHSLGKMTTNNLLEYDLLYDFLTHERLHAYFKHKAVNNLVKYIIGVKNLMDALDTHESEVEKQYFYVPKLNKSDAYTYSSDLANFLSQIFQFIVQNSARVDDTNKEIVDKLLTTFCGKCHNLKTLLSLTECVEKHNPDERYNRVIEGFKARTKLLSEDLAIIKSVRPKNASNPGCLATRKLNIDTVLNDLFKIATSSDSKEDYNELNNEALELFDELEAYIAKAKKYPVHQIPEKTFKVLDTMVGSKCSMAEANAWKKVITSLSKTGILNDKQQTNILMKKAGRFLSKKSFARNQRKMHKEIKTRYKEQLNGGEENKIQQNYAKMDHKTRKRLERKEFKAKKQREKAAKLLEEFGCPNGCTDAKACRCNKNAPKSLMKYKNKVEKFYEDKLKAQKDQQ